MNTPDLTPSELHQLVMITVERVNVLSEQLQAVVKFMSNSNSMLDTLAERLSVIEHRLDHQQIRGADGSQN